MPRRLRQGSEAQLGELGTEAGVAGCCGPSDECLRGLTERAELLLGSGFRPDRPPWRRPRAAVVLIVDGRPTRADQGVLGVHQPGTRVEDDDPRPAHLHRHSRGDERVRDRVAGRPQWERAQLVDLASAVQRPFPSVEGWYLRVRDL